MATQDPTNQPTSMNPVPRDSASLPQSEPFDTPLTPKKDTPVAGKAVILSSTQDNTFQPDSLRGSEHLLKDLEVEDQEEMRREEFRKQSPEDRK